MISDDENGDSFVSNETHKCNNEEELHDTIRIMGLGTIARFARVGHTFKSDADYEGLWDASVAPRIKRAIYRGNNSSELRDIFEEINDAEKEKFVNAFKQKHGKGIDPSENLPPR